MTNSLVEKARAYIGVVLTSFKYHTLNKYELNESW
jgi:hypothetical protein